MIVDEAKGGLMRLTRVALGTVALGLLVTFSVVSQDRLGAGAIAIPSNDAGGRTSGLVTASAELVNGFQLQTDLAGGTVDIYKISQKPESSYEVVVDATSGDIDPVAVQRFSVANTVAQSSSPVGTSQTVSLRWANLTTAQIDDETVRVQSGGCTTNCGVDDVYRIRAYETTYSVPRFNNSATQVTVLLLQNPANYTISGTVFFWSNAGAPAGTSTFTLTSKAVLVLNTSAIAPGASGSLTIAHDGRYGDLSGKTVALEPATGFSFDTPALPRVH
jgi:hypothetical protein